MKTVFLIWIMATSGTQNLEKRYQMPNMETCMESVKTAQIKIPSGGDAETTISIFCVTFKD